MFLTKRAIPRRTLLKSGGAVLALPLLDAMIPAGTAWAQTAAKPGAAARFCIHPHGLRSGSLDSTRSGKLVELSPFWRRSSLSRIT
jgi:hypothetical protein